MTETKTAPDVAIEIIQVLTSHDLPYAVGGALAQGFYGTPRATFDVDVNVFVDVDRYVEIAEALHEIGAEIDIQKAVQQAQKRGDMKAWVHNIRVDVFVPSIDLSWSASKRTQTKKILGKEIQTLSLEDIVLFKLLFFRQKDETDIERMIVKNRKIIDRLYVRHWLLDMVGEDDIRTQFWDRTIERTDKESL